MKARPVAVLVAGIVALLPLSTIVGTPVAKSLAKLVLLFVRYVAFGVLCDDSPWPQAMGFWNDSGVTSHTDRSVQAHKRDKFKATHVSRGTLGRRRVTAFIQENGLPWNAQTV